MLSQATLSHATLSHKTLSHRTLSHRTLSHKTLSQAKLSQAVLSHKTLSHVSVCQSTPPSVGSFQWSGEPQRTGNSARAKPSAGRSARLAHARGWTALGTSPPSMPGKRPPGKIPP